MIKLVKFKNNYNNFKQKNKTNKILKRKILQQTISKYTNNNKAKIYNKMI